MLSFNIHKVGSIKPNSWLLQASNQSVLWAGSHVDVRPESFFEGAWAGIFSEFRFSECPDVFGSGAVQTSEGWLIVSPSHTLEAVYVFRDRAGDWTVSNSLAFLKSFLRFAFQDSLTALVYGFAGIMFGTKRSPACIKTSHGTLYVLHHHNAFLRREGLTICKKPPGAEFNDFISYRSYLTETVRKVAANSGASERVAKYELLASISTGYDSPACAVLARDAGCRDAVTITRAQYGDHDDGTAIAERLGLKVKTFAPAKIGGENRQFVADMFATGTQAGELVYEPLRGFLSRRLLVTGFHGDKIWDRNGVATSIIKRGDISGCSLAEFRLSESFIHLPVPFIGARRHSEIKKIANSDEMRPYSVGGPYDRPVARRIVEEAGIERSLFGQKKKAVTILSYINKKLLRKEFRDEIGATAQALPSAKKVAYSLHSIKYGAERFVSWFLIRVTEKLRVRAEWLSEAIWWAIFRRPLVIWEHSDPFNVLALDWALSVLEQQYELPKAGARVRLGNTVQLEQQS
jgi:hypothetical protein